MKLKETKVKKSKATTKGKKGGIVNQPIPTFFNIDATGGKTRPVRMPRSKAPRISPKTPRLS